MSNTNPTAKKSSVSESPTVYWMPPLSSETSEGSTEKVTPLDIRAWLMWSPPGFLANRLALQERDKAQTMNETCGQPPSPPSARYDRDSACWKMSAAWLLPDISEPSWETWPKAGTIVDGAFYPQPKWERPIGVIGSGLWLTPDVPSGGRVNPPEMSPTGRMPDGTKKQVGLSHQVKSWPTPRASENDQGYRGDESSWLGQNRGETLSNSVNRWPTPQARDHFPPHSEECIEDRKKKYAQGGTAISTQAKGQLNPAWVAWLMGWPIHWDSLEPIVELDWRTWEADPADEPGDIPRVATGIKDRTHRLKALGNGQVPQCMATAWRLLTENI